MRNRIVHTGPIAPTPRGVQPPPSLLDRIERSCLIATGLVRTGVDGTRKLVVDEVLRGDPAHIHELESMAAPPFPIGERRIVILAARDRNGVLRLIADPRTVEPENVRAILAAMAAQSRPTTVHCDEPVER